MPDEKLNDLEFLYKDAKYFLILMSQELLSLEYLKFLYLFI